MQFLVSLKPAEYLHMGSLSSIASSWGESVRSAEKRVKPVPRVCRDGAQLHMEEDLRWYREVGHLSWGPRLERIVQKIDGDVMMREGRERKKGK